MVVSQGLTDVLPGCPATLLSGRRDPFSMASVRWDTT